MDQLALRHLRLPRGAQAETASLATMSGSDHESERDETSKETGESRSPDDASLAASTGIEVRGQASSAERQQEARQKREDTRSLQEAIQALKSLLEAIKKKIQGAAQHERQTDQDVASVEKQIKEVEQAMQSMIGSGLEIGIGLAAAATALV